VCPNCSRLVELDWSLCAWCGKDFERPELLHEVAVPPPVGRPIAAGEGLVEVETTTVPAIESGGRPRPATTEN
jgi:hypothetical protein